MKALQQIDRWEGEAGAVVIGSDGVLAEHGSLDSPRRWASVTKLVTAYATLLAFTEGQIDLDEQAGPPGSTIRHLLAHASGLPFEGSEPIAKPGRRRIYSNAAFDLIGRILTTRTGWGLDGYFHQWILGPLGIDAMLEGGPAEGLVGSVRGMARLAAEFLKPTLTASLVTARNVAFPGLAGTLPGVGRFDPLDWGLGFEIRSEKVPHWTGTNNSAETFGHFGGSGTFLWVDPTAELALAVASGVDFGPWALTGWPALADAVLAEARK